MVKPGWKLPIEGRQDRLAWVTGAGGFIGTAVAARLARDGWRILAFGNHIHDRPLCDGIQPLSETIDQDIVMQAVGDYGPPDLVVHAAGGSHVGQADAQPGLDFGRTVQTTGALVHGLGLAGCDGTHLIYPSSAAIYGQQPVGPIGSATPPMPISQYGWHKLMAETVCRQGAQRYGLHVTIIRFFSLYGPGLRKQLFWELGNRLRAGTSLLELGGTGEETRDFLSIGDAVDLICHLHGQAASGLQIVNGGSGQATRVADAISLFQQALGTHVPVRFTGQVRVHDPHHLCAGLGDMDWQPATDLATGLSTYGNWLRKDMAGGLETTG